MGKFQAFSHRTADHKVNLEASRLLSFKAAWSLDQHRNVSLEAAASKLLASEALVQAALNTIQIFGATGNMTETGLERIFPDAVADTIYSGTSEMQRNIIARWLGLYDQRLVYSRQAFS